MASLFLNRDGSVSIFRAGLAAAALGGLFLVGAVVFTAIESASFKAPLTINIPPDTQLLREETLSAVSSRIYYSSSQDAESVMRFYDAQLAESEGKEASDPNRERCIRTPRAGTFDNYQEGNGVVPYEYRCIFQEVSMAQGIDRVTMVVIQPGVRNNDTGMDNTNTTRIEYEQSWQP